jgi:hypothetical protein
MGRRILMPQNAWKCYRFLVILYKLKLMRAKFTVLRPIVLRGRAKTLASIMRKVKLKDESL